MDSKFTNLEKDGVTGAFTRRHIESIINEEVRRARRDDARFAVMIIDIDHFKLFNETLGRLWGDRLLKKISDVLRGKLKEGDSLGRLANDVFVAVVHVSDIEKANTWAKELVYSISQAKYPGQELFVELYPKGQLTASIGVTLFDPTYDDSADLMAWADYALFKAKRNGRNRVVVQDGPPHGQAGNPLKLFENISLIFAKATNKFDKLQQTVEYIQSWLNYDVCSLYLLEKGELVLRASVGLNPDSIGRVRMSPREGLTGLAIETLTTIVTREAKKHPRYKYFAETGEEELGSYLGVPILYESNPVGVIVLQTREVQDFSEQNITVVKTIANFIGGLISLF